MRGIELHNRENETKDIRAIADHRPTMCTSVYGSVNIGKTGLITHTTEELSEEYVVFYMIEGLIEDAREFGYKRSCGEEEIVPNEGHILKSLDKFKNKDHLKASELSKSVKLGLIKSNIRGLDPVKQIIKPQSRLDLLAIREVIR